MKKGEEDFRTFRKIMSDMLADIKRRGEPSETDTTIAAHLLRIRDPASGQYCGSTLSFLVPGISQDILRTSPAYADLSALHLV